MKIEDNHKKPARIRAYSLSRDGGWKSITHNGSDKIWDLESFVESRNLKELLHDDGDSYSDKIKLFVGGIALYKLELIEE